MRLENFVRLPRNKTKRRKQNVRREKRRNANVSGGTVNETENVIGPVEGIVVVAVIVIGTESLNETEIATGTEGAIRRTKTTGDLELHLKGLALRPVPRPSRAHRREEVDLETEPKLKLGRRVGPKKTICARKRRKKRPLRGRKPRRKPVKRKWLIR